MRFEVTHHLCGHDVPTHTLTDAAGVTALLHQAACTGSRLHIRPCAPVKNPLQPLPITPIQEPAELTDLPPSC
ncbi:MAG: hypothetical protein JWQ95_5294 [Sphaerisporangium sp.]|nr:hypothetical protein [Sphaerisporangium sp.]